MVRIPAEVKDLIESQGIFAVGSVGGSKFANISPRIFFQVNEDSIFWIDFFHHKSYRNFQVNPWATVAVFDKDNLVGFQLRGTVTFITDEPKKSEIKEKIIHKTLQKQTSEKFENLIKRESEVILFEPKVVYSLNPEKYTDLCIGSDVDATQLFQK